MRNKTKSTRSRSLGKTNRFHRAISYGIQIIKTNRFKNIYTEKCKLHTWGFICTISVISFLNLVFSNKVQFNALNSDNNK